LESLVEFPTLDDGADLAKIEAYTKALAEMQQIPGIG